MNLGENLIKRSKHDLAAISELELSGFGDLLVVVEINVEENVFKKA